MSRDPDPGAAPRPRPLPTVDVAILRQDRDAVRARNMVIGGVVAVAAVVGVAVLFRSEILSLFSTQLVTPTDEDGWPAQSEPAAASDHEPSEQASSEEPHAAAAPDETPSQETSAAAPSAPETMDSTQSGMPSGTTTSRFGEARGFRDALLRAGVAPQDASALVTSLEKLVDFRRCRPEDELTFTRDESGTLVGFQYQATRTEFFRATRKGSEFKGEKVQVPIEVRHIAKGGHVRDSLGKALDHLDLGTSLVGAFVEAFEREVSFKKDTREGDAFRILVDEQYIEGELLGYGTVNAVEYSGERMGTLRGYWFEPKGQPGDFYDAQGRAMNGGWLRTPLRYDHISSRFDMRRRHPVLKRIVPHQGVDYAASSGTPVWAAAAGTITFAGTKGANGNLVAIKHANGYETFYAHLSRITKGIHSGVHVAQRQSIGAVGTTGRSTGPHLHFALKHNGRFIDPAKQLNGPGEPVPSRDRSAFNKRKKQLDKALAAIVLAPAPPADGSAPEGDSENFDDEAPLEL